MRQYLLLTLLAFATASPAANYCVTSGAGFRQALAAAAPSPDADQIRFVAGAIALDADVDANTKVEGNLQLRGGYASGCLSRLDPKHVSRIDGNGFKVRIVLRRYSDLDVEQMHFHGAEEFIVGDNVAETPGPYGVVRITRSAFRDFEKGPRFPLLRHDVRISNSVFAGNDWGISLDSFHNPDTNSASRFDVINSTVVDNGVGIFVGSLIGPAASNPPTIVNSIIANNLDADLALLQPVIVRYSIVRTVDLGEDGALHANSQANLASAPMLDAKLVPLAGSPALDSGDDSVLESPFILPDFAVKLRRIGAHVDRGALEKQASVPGLPLP
jgi:hypothetical protein